MNKQQRRARQIKKTNKARRDYAAMVRRAKRELERRERKAAA